MQFVHRKDKQFVDRKEWVSKPHWKLAAVQAMQSSTLR